MESLKGEFRQNQILKSCDNSEGSEIRCGTNNISTLVAHCLLKTQPTLKPWDEVPLIIDRSIKAQSLLESEDNEGFQRLLEEVKKSELMSNLQEFLLDCMANFPNHNSQQYKKYNARYNAILAIVTEKIKNYEGNLIAYPLLTFFNLNLSGRTLSRVSLERCRLMSANFSNSRIDSVDFYSSEASGIDMRGASLSDVEFTRTNLSDSKWNEAKFVRKVRMSQAKLCRADFRNAVFQSRVVFNDADLSGAQINAEQLAMSDMIVRGVRLDIFLQAFKIRLIKFIKSKKFKNPKNTLFSKLEQILTYQIAVNKNNQYHQPAKSLKVLNELKLKFDNCKNVDLESKREKLQEIVTWL